jgi:integrase
MSCARFWFGLDDPNCPGDRLSKLALKLSLVTLLRTGECVCIERSGVTADSVTIPLKNVKSRRAKKARPVVQPLNSLARETLGETFSIGDPDRKYVFPGSRERSDEHMAQQSLGRMMARKSTDRTGQTGLCEFLGLVDVTPHDLRRTGATILSQLGFDDALIGKVMTHKTADRDAAPVTRERYLVPVQIIARPVDPRVKALDDLDLALREILGLPRGGTSALPAPARLLTAA